jgi:hypothetical protein
MWGLKNENLLLNKPINATAAILPKIDNFTCVTVGSKLHDNVTSPEMTQIMIWEKIGMSLEEYDKTVGSATFANCYIAVVNMGLNGGVFVKLFDLCILFGQRVNFCLGKTSQASLGESRPDVWWNECRDTGVCWVHGTVEISPRQL